MDGSNSTTEQWLALMIIGLHVSVLGVVLDEVLVVILGLGFSLVVYFANFYEN